MRRRTFLKTGALLLPATALGASFRDIGYMASLQKMLRFVITYNASATAPVITAATLKDSDLLWVRPDGTTSATKTPAAAFFNAGGTYTLSCTDWSKVTGLDFHQAAWRNWLNTTNLTTLLPLLSALETLSLYNNSAYADNVTGWILPGTLKYLYSYSTAIVGDVSGWVLPAALLRLYIFGTSVSGDISGWTLPSTLEQIWIFSTSVSGNISGWTLSASLSSLRGHSTSLDYNSSGGAFTGATDADFVTFNNCAWTQAQVDNALADCDTSGAINGTLDVSGTNAAPSAAGLVSKANLVSKGWTVTTN